MARPGRPNASDPRIELMTFDIESGDNKSVKKLLKETGVDACDGYLRTALLWAAFYNNLALLDWLLANGAAINHQDRNGYSALHFAAQEKRYDAARMLLEKGAVLDIPDKYGNTPLWTAIFNSKDDIQLVRLFIAHGANPDHLNAARKTPRQLARTFGEPELLALLGK